MKNQFVFLGICCGVIIGLVVVALLFKKKVLDVTFDERQERIRGMAYKYAFFTLMIAVWIYGALDLALGRWCDTLAGISLCVGASITVFAVICIVKDAYLGLKERPRAVMTLFVLLTVFNLGIGGMYLASGELVEDGVLTFRAVNPIVGLVTLVILIVYLVNVAAARKEG